MPLAKFVFAIPSVWQIWSRSRVQSWTVWKFYGDFVNPAFESIWPDDDYQYSKFTYNKVLKAQGIKYAIVSWRSFTQTEVYRNSFATAIVAALRSHRTLSNSEASPRIWTSVTRPFRAHVRRVWARNCDANQPQTSRKGENLVRLHTKSSYRYFSL